MQPRPPTQTRTAPIAGFYELGMEKPTVADLCERARRLRVEPMRDPDSMMQGAGWTWLEGRGVNLTWSQARTG